MSAPRRSISMTPISSWGAAQPGPDPGKVKFCRRLDNSARDEVIRSWKHVKDKTGSDAEEKYRDAVNKVREKAKEVYINDRFDQIPGDDNELVQILIDQCCFILQIALLSLGGPKPLDYPKDDPIFGNDWDKERIRSWISNMFFITKQFPLVVLKEMMKQSFFQDVLKRGKWKRPKDLQRMVLYDTLVEPHLQRGAVRQCFQISNCLPTKKAPSLQDSPTLIHALWLLLAGPGCSTVNGDDYDADEEQNSVWFTVRSATELQKAGIIFRSTKEKGTSGIKFKNNWYRLDAYLYLPSLSIEPNTKTLFESLIDYEGEIYPDTSHREVCAYLKFIREIIRTAEDAKVLALYGIIHADPESEGNLTRTLDSLRLPEPANNRNLSIVRQKVHSYVKPSKWEKVVSLVVFTLFLTLVQTIYAVVAYHKPNKN